jgi:hypothetical protein
MESNLSDNNNNNNDNEHKSQKSNSYSTPFGNELNDIDPKKSKLYTEMKIIQVDRISSFSVEEFMSKYFHKQIPVIITDEARKWPAFQKWNLDYLEKEVGSNKVEVREKTSSEQYKLGIRNSYREMSFAQYVNWHRNGTKEANDHYLAVQNLRKTFPQLSKDVPSPNYMSKLHCGPYLWIAPLNHFEYLHLDPDDNFCVIIKGAKRFRMFGTQDFMRCYPNLLGSHVLFEIFFFLAFVQIYCV